jgi:hypothetical protein
LPFRSDAEQIRENVRRLDEQAAELREEHAALERQVADSRRPRVWAAWLIGGIAVSSLVGYEGGAFQASLRSMAQSSIRDREALLDLERERARRVDCGTRQAALLEDVSACRAKLADAYVQARPEPVPSPCPCLRGDPLCTCAFDLAVATASFEAARPRARSCFKSSRTTTFHVKVTFAGTGLTDAATIDTPDDLPADEERCLVTVFRALKIDPFGGPAVTLGKAYAFDGT